MTLVSRVSARARVAVAAAVAVLAGSAATLVPSAPVGAANTAVTTGPELEFTYSAFDRSGGTTELFSGAAVGNVTGDAAPEIVAGGNDGILKVWSKGGALLLAYKVGGGAIQSSPTLVDVNRDGLLDILTSSISGEVEIITGWGARLFKVLDRHDMPKRGVFGTPTVGDIDRDGQLEVIATSWDHHLHVWNLDGSRVPGFPVFVYDTLWSSPAVVDLDGDGWLEIVFGGDMDEYPGAPYPRGGLLWVLRHDGTRQPGFPKPLNGQAVWSSPAVVDVSGDGKLDILIGTGLNWPDPDGHHVFAVDRAGNFLPGWPVNVSGRVMASPAVGDITGDGRPEVVTLAEDGRVYAHAANGALVWRACVVSNTGACRTGYGVHGQVTLADVDSDGVVEVISAAEHYLRILDGRTGAQEVSSVMEHVWAPGAAPTVAQIDGQAWVLVNSIVNTHDDGDRNVGDTQKVWIWKTGKPLGNAPWPTFKGNMRRTGALFDDIPPTASMGSLAAEQDTTAVKVSWTGADSGGSGIARYYVDVKTDANGWVHWLTTSKTSATMWALPGSTYAFRVKAQDRAGNFSTHWSASVSTSVLDTATRSQPITAGYAVSNSGDVSTLSSPPVKDQAWPAGLGRSIALRGDGKGGYLLDGWGGVHPFGNAPAVPVVGYWPGWDIARGLALNSDGASGYKLDGWGGLHPFGGAAKVSGPYFKGQDIARDLVLLPTSTKADPAGYVLDAHGGVHAFGSAPKLSGSGRRWGWAIGRAFTLNPAGPGGWILDGWGALHSVGGAPAMPVPNYWRGWDIARDAVALSGSSGYVLDGFGGIHTWGSVPKPQIGTYWGRDVARAMAVLP